MAINDIRKTSVRYVPGTPPPEGGYPPLGKTALVTADLLARAFGGEKPEMRFKPVNLEELCCK